MIWALTVIVFAALAFFYIQRRRARKQPAVPASI